MMTKSSASANSRSIPGGVAAFLLVLMSSQVGNHVISKLWQNQDGSWLPSAFSGVTEQAEAFEDEQQDLEHLLEPITTEISTPITSQAQELASPPSMIQDIVVDNMGGMKRWGEKSTSSADIPQDVQVSSSTKLDQMLEMMEARMQAHKEGKSDEIHSTPWARGLAQSQQFFQEWNEAITAKKQADAALRQTESDGTTAWGQSLERMQQQFEDRMQVRNAAREPRAHFDGRTAWGETLVKMQEDFEARMQVRESARVHTAWGDSLVQLQDSFEARMQARAAARGSQDEVHGNTAWGETLMKLQEDFETRMQARKAATPSASALDSHTAWGHSLVRLQNEFEARMQARQGERAAQGQFDGRTAWGDSLVKLQEDFEARMQARESAKASQPAFDGRTAWGESLVKLQNEFEVRMQARQSRADSDGRTAWGDSLVKLQEDLEARMAARKSPPGMAGKTAWSKNLVKTQQFLQARIDALKTHVAPETADEELDGSTAWSQGLLKMQESFETRMRARDQRDLKQTSLTSWAKDLIRTQKFFEKWDADMKAKREARATRTELAGTTAWGQSLIELQDEFESRMQARDKSRSSHATLTTWAEGLVHLQGKLENQIARLGDKSGNFDEHTDVTAWGRSLVAMQEEFDSRMRSRSARSNGLGRTSATDRARSLMMSWDLKLARRQLRPSVRRPSVHDGTTEWARNLAKVQDGFEARMQARNEKRARRPDLSPFAKNLMQSQIFFESWNAAITAQKQARAAVGNLRATSDHRTAWGQSLLDMQQAFEARMQSHNQRRSDDASLTPWAKGLIKTQRYFEERDAEIVAKRPARSNLTPWASGVVHLQAQLYAQISKLEIKRNVIDRDETVTSWGLGLVKMQQQFERQMRARSQRRSKRDTPSSRARAIMQKWDLQFTQRHSRGSRLSQRATTAWGQSLVAMQEAFEVRMDARSRRELKRSSASTRARSLMRQWDIKLAKVLRSGTTKSTASAKDMTSQGQKLEGMLEALETHMQSRHQTPAAVTWTNSLKQSQKSFEAWNAEMSARKQSRSWQQDFPGARQARAEHGKRMRDLESRKQTREEARAEKKAFAQSTQDAFEQYFKARRQEQEQRRREKN